MTTSKATLNCRQQHIKHIVQFEKENGYDLTKKDLIDRIRKILEDDYQMVQHLKEKELREKEFRRIRKLHRDGKLSVEEEEYSSNDSKSQKHTGQQVEKDILIDAFQPNPTHSYRHKEYKRIKNEDQEEASKKQENEKEDKIDQNEESESNTNNKGNMVKEIETKVATDTNQEKQDQGIAREKSELTVALENETDLKKLYELAEKMVFVSHKK